jgi:hypothetical protein
MRFKYHFAEWVHDQKWATIGYWLGVVVTFIWHTSITAIMAGWGITVVCTVIGG